MHINGQHGPELAWPKCSSGRVPLLCPQSKGNLGASISSYSSFQVAHGVVGADLEIDDEEVEDEEEEQEENAVDVMQVRPQTTALRALLNGF